jgi:hypothetical protein
MTEAGAALLNEAAPRHLALIDQLFWSPLTVHQRATLGALAGRLLDAEAPPC